MTSEDALKIHLVEKHGQSLRANDIEKLLPMGARKVAQVSEATCPLCRETMPSVEKYMKHVGRHQEDLALFALPNLEGLDEHAQDEDESVVGEYSGLLGENGTDLQQSGELDSEHDDYITESQSSDDDETGEEAIGSPSRNDERSRIMTFDTILDSARHEQLDLVSTTGDAVDNDQQQVQDRKPLVNAGHEEKTDQQRLDQRKKEAEEQASTDGGGIGSNYHYHSNHSSSHSRSRTGLGTRPVVGLNETEPKRTVAPRHLEAKNRSRAEVVTLWTCVGVLSQLLNWHSLADRSSQIVLLQQ